MFCLFSNLDILFLELNLSFRSHSILASFLSFLNPMLFQFAWVLVSQWAALK